MQGKKFISPQSWFSLIYPSSWSEFEDREGSFLFYNPDRWTGNFRISAYKKERKLQNAIQFAQEEIQYELNTNKLSKKTKINSYNGVYYSQSNKEDGVYYTTHHWLFGEKNCIIECSFTVPQGVGFDEVAEILKSIEIHENNKKYSAELIPIRLAEIYSVNEAYDEVTKTIKKSLAKDFQGIKEDLDKLQKVIDKDLIGGSKRKDWFSVGITLCVVLYNEIEGFEWKTLIDGNREAPILYYSPTKKSIDPINIAWDYVDEQGFCNMNEIYKELLDSLS